MTDQEVYNLIHKPGFHTNEDLAQIALYKAENAKAEVPPIIFRLMAGRLRAYERLQHGVRLTD